MLKILHVIFTEDFGGAERAASALANAQAQSQTGAGHEVRILIRPQKKEPHIKTWLHENVQTAEVWTFFQTRNVQTHVDIFQPDVIHAHLGNACKVVAKVKADVPKIATLHMGYKPKQHAELNGLIALNEAQATTAKQAGYTGRLATLPLVIPPLRDVAEGELEALRQQFHIPQKTCFGCIGRLHAEKGLAELISAFQQANLGEDAALVIIGEGEEEVALKAHINGAENIHLIPFQADIAPWYHLFHTLVSASQSETFGITLLQGMQAGCHILATPTDGAKTVLANQPALVAEVADFPQHLQALAQKTGREAYSLSAFKEGVILEEIYKFYCMFEGV